MKQVLLKETIAVIFDFDDTLAPDTTSGFLADLGVDVPEFWQKEVQALLNDDWDPVPAYMSTMIDLSRSGRVEPITRDRLQAWGRQLPLHRGVTTIFDRLRAAARDIDPRVSLEFYVISSGIEEVLRHTVIAGEFQDIWASQFAYDGDGAIDELKKVVSFTDKTRYLFHVQKGIFGAQYRGKPFEVNRKIAGENLRIPLNNMIFVGDGYTDVPCFSLVRKEGGYAIGVYDADSRDKWGRAWGFIEDGRVSNLVPADYEERSALSNSLVMAVESIARRITLASSTYQG